MKKYSLISSALLIASISTMAAANYLWLNTSNGFSLGMPTELLSNIAYNQETQSVEITTTDEAVHSYARTQVSNVRFGEAETVVKMVFDGNNVSITNPYAFQGVEITREGAHVTIVSSALVEIEYEVSGTSDDGQIKYYTTSKDCEGPKFTFNGLTLTNKSGAAFNSQSSKKIEIKNQNGTVNTLCDAAEYTATPEDEDEKGTLFCEGKIEFKGKGTLNVTGLYKHAIVNDKGIAVTNGTVNVMSAVSDGFHANDYFNLTGGTATTKATGGDGIDTGTGPITITDGKLNIELASEDCKAIKSDSDITFNGGKTLSQSTNNDGIDSNGTIVVNGGIIVALGARQPECGFDCDNNRFTVTGGTFIGIGGDNSTPTSSVCTQPVLNYSSTLAQNATFAIVDNSGNLVFAFTNPRADSGSTKKLVSAPGIVKGSSYKLYTGGTVSSSETFHGLHIGGEYTPGTQSKSFTVNSMLQTL